MHGAVALSAPLVASRARLGGRVTVSRARATKAVVGPSSSSRRVMTRLRASVETPETASSEAEEAWNEDDIDNIEFAATKLSDDAAIANKDGAGATMAAPDWLTQLNRLWGGNSEIPVADAKLEDITGLLGGGLFQPLFKWMKEAGPVYLLPTGPVTSYVVVSDPDCIKQILFNYGSKYIKGTIAEAGEFLFGLGVALQENEAWKIRRKAVAPSLHRRYVEAMVDRCFGPCAERMVELMEQTVDADGGEKKRVNMESKFSQAALDIIGISVFNYDFKALTSAAPVIQATYTALKEVETRSMDLLPTWRLPEPFLRVVSPRQKNAQDAVTVIQEVTTKLVDDCKRMVEEEEKVGGAEVWATTGPSTSKAPSRKPASSSSAWASPCRRTRRGRSAAKPSRPRCTGGTWRPWWTGASGRARSGWLSSWNKPSTRTAARRNA